MNSYVFFMVQFNYCVISDREQSCPENERLFFQRTFLLQLQSMFIWSANRTRPLIYHKDALTQSTAPVIWAPAFAFLVTGGPVRLISGELVCMEAGPYQLLLHQTDAAECMGRRTRRSQSPLLSFYNCKNSSGSPDDAAAAAAAGQPSKGLKPRDFADGVGCLEPHWTLSVGWATFSSFEFLRVALLFSLFS